MSKQHTKRQRTDVSENKNSSEGSALDDALRRFDCNYKSFLKECMKRESFSESSTQENNKTYFVAMLKVLGIDIRTSKDFNIQCRQGYLSLSGYIDKVQSYHEVIQDFEAEAENISKIIRLLKLYGTESCIFRKVCMLQAGYDESKVSENNQEYIVFMLKSMELVKGYLDELGPKIKKLRKESLINTKNTNLNQNFPTVSSNNKFTSINFVHESTHYTLYKARQDGSDFAIKVQKKVSDHSNSHSLENELHATQHCSHPCLRIALGTTTYQNKPAIALEWVDGKPIEEYGKLHLKDFMFVARELTSAVVTLHDQNINHLNITTSNILVNLQTRLVKLIGFTSSSKYETTNFDIGNQKRLVKSSKYIPPEQTGCINLHVDLRSDFYDLGMIFYFMLMGDYPFSDKEESQLVHNSLFSSIQQLNQLDPSIPLGLSNMISKLLERDPGNRYQSARGILYDLDFLNEDIVNLPEHTFRLAERDFSSKLLIPQKLYGRSSEVKTLKSAFEKSCNGSLEVIFIKGLSGTGKTHLANELLESVTRKNGIFIHGKFEESSMTVPYSGIIAALHRFCNIVLLEGSKSVSFYKDRILDAVGEEGGILLNLVPELRHIIGEQRDVVEAIGIKAKNRLDYICCSFLRAICTKDRPLVFLLDDLHRADGDSYPFLTALLKDRKLKHLLFIGTYHSDKVDFDHPLTNTITLLHLNKVTVKTLELKNLSNAEVNNLIADTVSRDPIAAVPLTALVVGKTSGNPFFVTEFLKSLQRKGLLYFCKENLCWKWTIEEFVTKKITDNVINFITEKILHYDVSMRKFLIYASFIGSSFSLKTIKLIDDSPVDIDRMIEDGFITPKESKDSYRFTHDYVRQAVFFLVPRENRDLTYFNIGNLIWKKSSKVEMQDNLFVVAQMLNTSLHQLNSQEKRDVAELNFQAANKCITLTAFKPALDFLETGIQLLANDSWQVDYEFTLNLYHAAAEVCYCLMNYVKMGEYIATSAINAKCELDLVPSYLLQIRTFNHQFQYKEALKFGLRVLDSLGEKLSLKINDETSSKELIKSILQASQNIADINNLIIVEDQVIVAIFKILHELFFTAFFYNAKLLPIISGRMFQLTCSHGLSQYSSLGISMVGKMLCDRGEFTRGFSIGKLALEIIDKFKAKDMRLKVLAYTYRDVYSYKIPIHKMLDPLYDGIIKGLEVGDNDGCTYAFSLFYFYSLHSGKNLQSLMDDFDNSVDKVHRNLGTTMSMYQLILNLLGYANSKRPGLLIGDYFDYRKSLDFNNRPGSSFSEVAACMTIACFFYEYDCALEWLNLRDEIRDREAMKIHPFLTFYEGLILLAAPSKNCSKYKEKIDHCINTLRSWSQSCEENFSNKLLLLEAEFASKMIVNCKIETIVENYDKAISSSIKNGFIHETALAYERAAITFMSSKTVDPSAYFQKAFEAYKEWGATAKCIHLVETYSAYFEDIKLPSDIYMNENQSCTVSKLSIDTNNF